jgi:ferredoxin-nitrite reductase
MPEVEGRIAPDGTLYFINLTAQEAQKVLSATTDSCVTPFQCSVSCIGGVICSTGVRDSQGLLMAMMEAVEEADLPGDALPQVHVSGCPSSCGTQQIGMLGFQGGSKMVDGQAMPAFTLLVNGREGQGQEQLGQTVGVMLQEEIPAFIVELGKTVAASGMGFEAWLAEHEGDFLALAGKYI